MSNKYNQHDMVKEKIRAASDLVRVVGESVELRKAGSNYIGLCPFHAEKTPSFSVNPAKQFFHCFGCGESGDVFAFLMKYHRLSFPEALQELANRAGIDLPRKELTPQEQKKVSQRKRLYMVNEAAADIYSQLLHDSSLASRARAYLEGERGVKSSFWQRYRLGYAPHHDQAGWSYVISKLRKHGFTEKEMELAGLAVAKERGGYYDRFRGRVMFPILDLSNRVVAFGGRILGDEKPKYMNSPETILFDKSRLLFGLAQHKENLRNKRIALVVEGNFDLLSLSVYGIDYTVAPLGTSLTREHVRSLKGFCDRVILLFDGDSAGLKAAMRSVPFFLSEQVEGKVAILPEGHDPDTLVREMGREGVEGLLSQAQGMAEFVFSSLLAKYGLTVEGKGRIMEELQPLIREADSGQRELMLDFFSKKLGVSPAVLRAVKVNDYNRQERNSVPDDNSPERVSFFDGLRGKNLDLVKFIVLYPEFLPDLLELGLKDAVQDDNFNRFISFLENMAESGSAGLSSENIYEGLKSQRDKKFVAHLFMKGSDDLDTSNFKEEMFLSVKKMLLDIKSAAIQEQIHKAEHDGDMEKLQELVKVKQDIRKGIVSS